MDELKDEIDLEPDVVKPHRIYKKENETKVDKNEIKPIGEGVEGNKTILVKKLKLQKGAASFNKLRWSAKEGLFRKNMRVSESVKQAELNNEDRAPLYS